MTTPLGYSRSFAIIESGRHPVQLEPQLLGNILQVRIWAVHVRTCFHIGDLLSCVRIPKMEGFTKSSKTGRLLRANKNHPILDEI